MKRLTITAVVVMLVVGFCMPAMASSRLRAVDTQTILRPGVALEKEAKEGDCAAWKFLPNWFEVTVGVDLEDINRNQLNGGLIKNAEIKVLKVFKF